MVKIDPYKILGVRKDAPLETIKAAFRLLAKKHHPDTGGDENNILKINAAWEILKDEKNRKHYDQISYQSNSLYKSKSKRNSETAKVANGHKSKSEDIDNQITYWIMVVYKPIDRLLGEVINPFPKQLKNLSGDPYDDLLMGSFCSYIEKSQKKLKRIQDLYQSIPSPDSARNFALSLYQCFSEVQDALNELERYTAGYVDNYLHDGQEMIRSAKTKRSALKKEKSNLALH